MQLGTEGEACSWGQKERRAAVDRRRGVQLWIEGEACSWGQKERRTIAGC